MLTELIKRFEAAMSSAARKIANAANALAKIADQAKQSTLSAAELAEAIYYKAVDGADEVVSENYKLAKTEQRRKMHENTNNWRKYHGLPMRRKRRSQKKAKTP